MLVCIVGTSGSGKTTLAQGLKRYGFNHVITYTTRDPRPGEVDGRDCHFVTTRKFLDLMQMNSLEETTTYDGNLYGTPRVTKGVNNVVVVDNSGYLYYKGKYPKEVVGIYLDMPVSMAEQRLTDAQLARARRKDRISVYKGDYTFVLDATLSKELVLSSAIQCLRSSQTPKAM